MSLFGFVVSREKKKKIEVHVVLFLKGFAQTDALTVNVLHVVT